MITACEKLQQRWLRKLEKFGKDSSIEISQDFSKYALDIIGKIGFASDFGCLESPINDDAPQSIWIKGGCEFFDKFSKFLIS